MNSQNPKEKERKEHEGKREQRHTKSAPRHYPYVAFVSFKESKKMYTFGCENNHFKVGDQVVFETVRGVELGAITKECEVFIANNNGMEIKPILRKARPKDFEDAKINIQKAKEALKICDQHIKKLNLNMYLIEAEYTLDRNKLIFVYVAEERVDFRELLKELAAEFKCRIE